SEDDRVVEAVSVTEENIDNTLAVGVKNVAEERSFREWKGVIRSPAEGGHRALHPQGDVHARCVDVGHHASRDCLLAVLVARAIFPGWAESQAALEGVPVARLILFRYLVARR